MRRRDRRVLLGVIGGAFGVVGGLLLLGLRSAPTHPHPGPGDSVADAPPQGPLAGVWVILDPGHGGEDPGTTAGPLSEAALTYRLATEVTAALRASGANVVYTVRSRSLDPALAVIEPPLERPTDAALATNGRPLRARHSAAPLWQRAALARTVWERQASRDPNARRDVFFLSLHFDQFGTPGVAGGEVCVDRRAPHVPSLAPLLATSLAQGGFGRGTDYQGIKGLSGHELAVLNPAHNPVPESVLVELATLSNPQDALNAADPTWRSGMARRIADAIISVHQGKTSP